MTEAADATETQRLDRWLWCARIFKTRALAAKTVSDAGIRLSRHGQTQRTEKPSFAIRPGDTLTLTKNDRVLILEVLEIATRRGPAPEARTLYTDHSPPPPPKVHRPATPFPREAGSGRPTKKDRRAMDALRDSS